MLNSKRSALQVLFVPQRAQKYHLNAVLQYSGSSPCLYSLRVSPQAGPTEGQGAAREVKTNTSKGDRSVVRTTLTFLRSVGFGVWFFFFPFPGCCTLQGVFSITETSCKPRLYTRPYAIQESITFLSVSGEAFASPAQRGRYKQPEIIRILASVFIKIPINQKSSFLLFFPIVKCQICSKCSQ